MKDFSSWGTKMRILKEYNYFAIWKNLKTIRLGESKEDIKELPPALSEFYDVGINNLCNAECPFCYVNATSKGENFPDICGTWKKWMDKYPFMEAKEKGYTMTTRPFQIAIGEF